MTLTPRSLRRTLLVSAAAAGLLVAGPALALSGPEAIRTATAACLDSAGKQGWRTDLAKVISSRSINADKVEVVFDLTRDGTNTAGTPAAEQPKNTSAPLTASAKVRSWVFCA